MQIIDTIAIYTIFFILLLNILFVAIGLIVWGIYDFIYLIIFLISIGDSIFNKNKIEEKNKEY